jgi:hypothetical protein
MMRARWPRRLLLDDETATVLARLGIDLPARMVAAFVYPTWEAAGAFAYANLTRNGLPTLGSMPAPGGGVVAVLDLRPALERLTGHG